MSSIYYMYAYMYMYIYGVTGIYMYINIQVHIYIYIMHTLSLAGNHSVDPSVFQHECGHVSRAQGGRAGGIGNIGGTLCVGVCGSSRLHSNGNRRYALYVFVFIFCVLTGGPTLFSGPI